MLIVNRATWTSGEPVSPSACLYSLTIAAFSEALSAMMFSSINMQFNYSPPVHIYRWVVAVIIHKDVIRGFLPGQAMLAGKFLRLTARLLLFVRRAVLQNSFGGYATLAVDTA